ncbi:type III-B CRISPR module RAMP protein Cmr6 [Fontivita pretiosa]|uniref:type III-B CRISPR module RAMP protein Cmr6 n=1 Tax=Fontivita pretiosa TaxID=2989684 RepID=UPI003D16836D
MSLVLPQSTVRLIDAVANTHRHPGLQLDKFSVPGDQTAQKAALTKVCNIPGDAALLTTLIERRERLLGTLPGARSFSCATTGPLTLHLARASALENAGICLHPLYGFAYLPGSGLKGMARAYAETIWLPTQPDQKQAWRQIEDVFGWAPNPDRRQQINNSDHPAAVRRKDEGDPESPEIKASSGNIVFHDAWPESWPKLIVDIVNNHHPHYYTGQASKLDEQGRCSDCKFRPDDPNAHPPGDWENPVPVYFLALKPGTTFTFPLAKRRADVADELLNLAREWLLGALCQLGAGAKTNAGYGAFKPADGEPPALPTQKRAIFETTLELLTPAFLAGANQQAEDCDLRPATLRGLLRWWWRTMHAGFVDVKMLRALEAAIWGDTKNGGAVRIVLEKDSGTNPQPYDKRSKANFNDQQKQSDHGIPNENPKKVTQGLWYASYGMDETSKEQRKQRYYLEPGASWRLRLIARSSRFFIDRKDADDPKKAKHGKDITAEQALSQAKASLWLLCHFGGVGSKARKGFGSLGADQLQDHSLESCRKAANELREHLGLSSGFGDRRAHSTSLQQMLGPVDVNFSWPNVWAVLDQVGFAYQAFAKKYKHNREKMALGLPRRIGNPVKGAFNPTPPVTTNSRHSSPVHIHVEGKPGNWTVRVIAFPAAHLPNLATSQYFLKEFLKDFGDDLQRRAALQPPPPGPRQVMASARQQAAPPSTGPSLPKPGDRVDAILLDEKTKRGGWKAKHVATGIAGPIQNSNDVPTDKKAGDSVTLIVASATQREIAFRYPTAADEQRAQKSQRKSKSSSGDKQPPRGGK